MDSIFHHKGVGYVIHTHNGSDWVWKIYPRTGEGGPICGSTRGNKDDAVSACVEAIELKAAAQMRRRLGALNRLSL